MKSFKIRIEREDGSAREQYLSAGIHIIGRDVDCDVVIDSPSVSRRHARLDLREDDFTVEDLSSTSGTLAGDEPITSPARMTYPQGIVLGSISLRIETEEGPMPNDAGTSAQSGGTGKPGFQFDPEGDRYSVETEIARGGMGVIYRTRDKKLGRELATKVMLDAGKRIVDARTRFVQEAGIMARMEHPNIVPVHDFGVDANGRPYYTMKEVRGRTLQDIVDGIREGNPEDIARHPLHELLTIFRKACDGVSFAHSKGVVHRDLKPENVMIGEYGEVLVMDWGLAKDLTANPKGGHSDVTDQTERTPTRVSDSDASGSSSSRTMDGSVMGTPRYMPPEQAQGRVAELRERSDIYSLGGILYTLLTLQPPIEGTTLYEVLLNVERGRITPPLDRKSASSPDSPGQAAQTGGRPHCPGGRIPAALSAVAMKALAKDPDDRYQSVRQLALEIERYQEGFATSVEDAGFATHLRLLIGRHRREFAVGAVSLTVVVALSVWFVINLRASERRATTNAAAAITNERKAVQSEHEARLLLAAASVAEADAAFRSGDYPGMVVALERCPAGLRNSNWEYLSAKRDASIGRLQIPGFESPLAIAAVPGAQGQFALVNGKWEIGFVEVPTGKLLRTIRAERPGMRGIAFSGDGRVFANWAGKNSDLVLYETATGKKQTSIPLPNDRILEIALDQTGDLMTVITWPGDKVMSLSLVDTRTRKTRWSKEDGGFGSATFLPGGDRLSIMGFAGLARMCWLCSAEDGRDLAQRIPVYCMCQAVHPNGRIIAVGTHEGNALLIDSTNGRVVQQGKLHSGALVSLTWTSDGHLLTLGSEGKITDQRWLFRLWDPENMALRATFAGMQPTIRPDWSFNPESGYLLSRETNGTPKIWRIPAGLEKARQLHSSEQAWSAAFLSDTVLIARKDFDLARYQIPASGRKMTELTNGPSLGATYLCSNPAKGVFAIAPKVDNPSHHLRFFKQDGSSIIESASYPLGQLVRDMAFDSSASRVAITLENGSIQIVSIKSGNLHLDLPGTFQRAAFAGQDTRLLALRAQTRKSDENEFYLQLLDELGRTLETATNRFHVGAFAVSADQKLAALGGSDRSVHLFDADTLVERSVFRAHDGEIGAMAFHPSKPILATASADGSVKLWDYRNGKLLDYYLGLGGNPVVVVFSPNGQLLAVDGQERTTRVFGVSKAAELTAK